MTDAQKGGIDYSTFFSKMAASSSGRSTFIQSCIDWARKLGFDGIDIVSIFFNQPNANSIRIQDWEYVGLPDRGGNSDAWFSNEG
jgi:chitinase